MFCNIIITRPFDQYFTYKLQKGQIVKKGTIVRVPFGKTKNQLGMVIETMQTLPEKNEYEIKNVEYIFEDILLCLLYTSPSPRDGLLSRMPSSA